MIQNGQNQCEEEETADNASTQKETFYVFDLKETEDIKEMMVSKITTKLWQIFPSICASLTCIPFGLMLGWPAVTYPLLLSAESPIQITMDQSAMIAGFLMLGVVLGTLFSTKQVANGPKYGIILANFFIFIGWIIMWKATNIYGLLSSRLIIGTGHGYGMGQIKSYIKEITIVELATILIKILNLFGIFGLLLAYLVGSFIDFIQYSFSCVILSLLILFLVILLPATPSELIQANKIAEAKKLLIFLKPDMNAENELNKVYGKLMMAQDNDAVEFNGFTKIMRNRNLRVNFIKLTILLIIQQYSGLAPTLIYTQILFEKSNVTFPEFISIGYSILFFLSSLIGTFLTPKYNKKIVLLVSSISILISFILNIIVIYYEINLKYFNYSSVIIMYFFLVIHTIGLGSIPFTLINDWFPKSYQTFVTNYFIILFSLLALTITKIFQVLITQFPFYIPFYLFSGVILFGIIFITLFIPYDLSLIALEGFYQQNTKNCIEEISIKKL